MGEPIDKDYWGELEPEEEEEEESSEEESDEDEDMGAPTDGTQTPSGLETPSGMASVVSTIAGGLETPDFLELRKRERDASEAVEQPSGPRSLYQVVPEKQSSVRGLMGSERGYDVSGVAASLPVLGDERGSKVCFIRYHAALRTAANFLHSVPRTVSTCLLTQLSWRACLRKRFAESTMRMHGAMLVFPEARRTSLIWWRRRCRVGGRRTENEPRNEVAVLRSTSSDVWSSICRVNSHVLLVSMR